MLCRERSIADLYRVENDSVDRLLMLVKKCQPFTALGTLHVVVQVAVAQVAEIDQPYAWKGLGQRRVSALAERWDRRDWQRDVVKKGAKSR